MMRHIRIALAFMAISVPPALAQLLSTQSMYGINTHVPSDAMIARCQAGNIAWARIDLDWYTLEPSRGVYNWAAIDAVVASANSRGIQLYATMAYSPAWSNGGLGITVPPTDPDDWMQFVRTTVNRYKGSIRHWGLWNEPDVDHFFSGTTSQYINMILIPGAQAIRQADPSALRCAPDLAGDSYFLQSVLSAAKDSIDVVTLHKYDQQVSDVMNKFDGFRFPWQDPNYQTVLQGTGAWGKAVWFTETGWRTAESSHAVTEQEQASLYTSLLDQVRQRAWINKIFFYELKDDPTAGVPKWGILNSDLTEKAAAPAYRDFVSAHPPGTGVTVTDLRRYSLARFSAGSRYFSDRSHTITSMPAYLQDAQAVQTSQDDAGSTAAVWIDFDVDRDAEVYIAYDARATSLPGWMSEFNEMGDVINLSDTDQDHAKLYRKVYRVGEIALGANMVSPATGAVANYFVLVIPDGMGPPHPASHPTPANGANLVSNNAALNWSAGSGTVSHRVQFGPDSPGTFRGAQSNDSYTPGLLDWNTTYYWRIDEENATGLTMGAVWSFRTMPAPGDLDGDGDVDQADFGQFQVCYSKNAQSQIPTACQAMDFNHDLIIDLSDVQILLSCMVGPGVSPGPECGHAP